MGHYVCRSCRASYALDEARWRCECGSLLDIAFEPAFDRARIQARKPTMWRYREALPIREGASIVSFDEGFTPLVEVEFDGRPVLLKQDHLFPTGSYKDRGASLLISKVKDLGIDEVVEDSSGNAGSAIAAYCAKAGVDCHIFVPEATSPGKVAQIRLYGARLNRIPGNREDTAAVALKAAEGIYYASHSWNPFFFQGTKTCAFEICEQLGWRAPDIAIVPVGNGTLLLGMHLGFNELYAAGIVDSIPRLIAVQAERCSPLYQTFKKDLDEIPMIEKGETIAEGIAIAAPVRRKEILQAVRESRGDFLAVSDADIIASLRMMGRKGFCIEPTSAATTAGVSQYLRRSSREGVIVSVLTGHGLKAAKKMQGV